jgi:acyl-CoA reductase-like NAD-dependent aldehyde dehydrogenase
MSSLDEAIWLANASRYGLGCNVYIAGPEDGRALHA